MADHKKTPDILGDLLGSGDLELAKKTAAQPVSRSQVSERAEYHNAGIPEGQKTIKPARKKRDPAAPKAPEKKPEAAPGDKVKATFYISGQIVEDLEEGWILLRKLSPKEIRSQVSKSLIVELAVQMALEDLKLKGEKSLLARKLKKE